MDNSIVFTEKYGRVFVNPAWGCASRCKFCYVEEFGFTHQELSPLNGESLKQELLKNAKFFPGREGTLISLSPDAEPFDKRVVAKTLDFIKALSPLGNPMQIATRRKVASDTVKKIVETLHYPNQLTLFVSSSTIKYHQMIELGTTIPEKRFENFSVCAEAGLSTCLYIKPVIPYVTIQDRETYVQLIKQYAIRYSCIGAFYANDTLFEHVNKVLSEIGVPAMVTAQGNLSLPFAEELHQVDNLEDMFKLETAFKATQCTVHRTSSCVVADILHIPSTQATWIKFPLLCVQCQDCAGLARISPPPVFRINTCI